MGADGHEAGALCIADADVARRCYDVGSAARPAGRQQTVTTQSGVVVRPLPVVAIWRAGLAPDPALLNELRECAIALGFTPASRGFTPNRIPR